MADIAVIGAGITGVTAAYALCKHGHSVTVYDQEKYPAMGTSYANGGQLSACNAEVWNSWPTVVKGMGWLFKKDAPLLFNITPSWHKYSWMAEFLLAIRDYEQNTVDTVRMAIEAREYLTSIIKSEQIAFDLETRGIIHFYKSKPSLIRARESNELLVQAGLDREELSASEIQQLEPAIKGDIIGGFYTQSDATGDIHKFTRALANACTQNSDCRFRFSTEVESALARQDEIQLKLKIKDEEVVDAVRHDAVVICAGVGSRKMAKWFGDRLNVYPVKGYSITVPVQEDASRDVAPWVSLLDDDAKIVTSRLGKDRYRVAGTAEFNGANRDIRKLRIEPLIRWVEKTHPLLDTSGSIPWSGLRPMMPDMMPRVKQGKCPRVFYNTGHGHLGWTLSAATAEMIAAIVTEQFRANRVYPVSYRSNSSASGVSIKGAN